MYIKVAIEPRTDYGLRWESVFYELSQRQRQLPSESSTIGLVAVVANIVAAIAAGFTFLHGWNRFWPAATATSLAILSLWILNRIYWSGRTRRMYAEQYERIATGGKFQIASHSDTTPPTG